MISTRNLLVGSAFAVAIAALSYTANALDQAAAQGMVQAPKFEVDPNGNFVKQHE